VTDLRRAFDGLSALVQGKLEQSPFSGHVLVFRGRRGDLIKVPWWDGDEAVPVCQVTAFTRTTSGIGSDNVGPLRWNGAHGFSVDQQQPHKALAYA
jgi:hypothetical protein